MAELLRMAVRGYNFLFVEITDHRVSDWFLIAKPYQGLILLGIYLMFVFKWGPAFMKDRPAYNMDRVIMAYNAIQVILCTTVFVKGLKFWGWGGTYKWICEPVDFSNSEDGLYFAELCYCYFLLKILDLLDTVFFVLRKKFNQITFLHIYHHTGMVLLIWGAVTYYPGGHGTFIGVVNCFVHAVMYSYYLLTVVYPRVRTMMWVKKLVTQLQIIQFSMFVVHMSTVVFKSDCQYPRWSAAMFLPQNLFMLILFIDFYIKTYIKKPNMKKEKIHMSNGSHENGIQKKDTSNGRIENNGNRFLYSYVDRL